MKKKTGNLLSGLPLYEESLRQYLNCSRRLLAAWDKNKWTVRSFPLTPDMFFALADSTVTVGWLIEAAALLVGYDGLSRNMLSSPALTHVPRCSL